MEDTLFILIMTLCFSVLCCLAAIVNLNNKIEGIESELSHLKKMRDL